MSTFSKPLVTLPFCPLGQLCDSRCTATFTNSKVIIDYKTGTILTGQRDPDSNLWLINFPVQQYNIAASKQPVEVALAANDNHKPANIVKFDHAALFCSPSPPSKKLLTATTLSTSQVSCCRRFANTHQDMLQQLKVTSTNRARSSAQPQHPLQGYPYSPSTTTPKLQPPKSPSHQSVAPTNTHTVTLYTDQHTMA